MCESELIESCHCDEDVNMRSKNMTMQMKNIMWQKEKRKKKKSALQDVGIHV